MLQPFAGRFPLSHYKATKCNHGNELWSIMHSVFDYPPEECRLSLGTGRLLYIYRDTRKSKRFKKLNVEPTIFGIERPFECNFELELDDNFFNSQFWACTRKPCDYTAFSFSEYHVTDYKLDDIRQREHTLNSQLDSFDCAFNRRQGLTQVPTLKWISLLHIHKYPTQTKVELFYRTGQFFEDKVNDKTFNPIVPKGLLIEISNFEQTCFRHYYDYKSHINKVLSSKLCCPKPCSSRCNLLTKKVLPEIKFSQNQWIARCIHEREPLYLVIPNQILGKFLIRRKVNLERLFLKKDLENIVRDNQEEICELAYNQLKLDKFLINRAQYGVVLWSDFIITVDGHDMTQAVDLNRIFRIYRNTILFLTLPKYNGENGVEKIVLEIDYPRFLVLVGKMTTTRYNSSC